MMVGGVTSSIVISCVTKADLHESLCATANHSPQLITESVSEGYDTNTQGHKYSGPFI